MQEILFLAKVSFWPKIEFLVKTTILGQKSLVLA